MNLNEDVEKRKVEIHKNTETVYSTWAKTGLLKGIDDSYLATQCALAMQNQFKANSLVPDMESVQFKRCSIPLVRRVFGGLVAEKLVSIQTMLAPQSTIYFQNMYGNLKEWPVEAKNSFFRSKLVINESVGLDAEAHAVATLAEDVVKEITREVISDIGRIAKNVVEHEWKNQKQFVDALRLLSGKIEREVHRPGNWLYVATNIVEHLSKDGGFVPSKNYKPTPNTIQYAGMLDSKFAVYSDTDFNPNEVVMGYKGSEYESGYQYCPHVMFMDVPKMGSNKPSGTLFNSYGKNLTDSGYFAKLNIRN